MGFTELTLQEHVTAEHTDASSEVKAGFSQGSSTAGDKTAAADIGAAAGGSATVMGIGQLWESAANANLIPSNLDCVDLALADEDLIATQDMTTK
ncbi:hypothetical protein HPB50_000123 [Hyalomma asiaticum]|uniref:Uncharacterized protein n=1 Tax=Hyalomma asiaticum TaxID=266040 RepID=A0ACB7TCD9_HYAAI|nr:hypothetical protein HPB50_000123 [Hyalomma asiaticum]